MNKMKISTKDRNYIKEPKGNSGVKNIITELKNLLEGHNIRFQRQKKERISELEDSSFEIIKSEEEKEKKKEKKQRPKKLMRYYQKDLYTEYGNFRGREKGTKGLFEEIIAQASQI